MCRRITPKNVYRPRKAYKTKRPIRGFKDLEIYQLSQEFAIEVSRTIRPFLKDKGYSYEEASAQTALSIPIRIANAYTQRFDDLEEAMETLRKVMSDCNTMMV